MTATFNIDGDAYTSNVLDFLVKKRAAVRSHQPLYGMVLKMLANSIYSATGYVNSHLYSLACAASTTAVGRWLSLIAELVFVVCGLEVVARDTNSCFIKATTTTATHYDYDLNVHAAAALRVLHSILQYIPLHRLTIACKSDETFYSLLLVKKKKYCRRTSIGTVMKGISTHRINRLIVVRYMVNAVIEAMHMDEPLHMRSSLMAKVIAYTVDRVVRGGLSVHEISKQVCRGGATIYRYKDGRDNTVYLRCDKVSPNSHVEYDMYTVLEILKTAVNVLTVPAGMDTIMTLYERSLTF